MKFARRFLINRGFATNEPVDHEDRAKRPSPAHKFTRVIQFSEPDFVILTGCYDWEPLLTGSPFDTLAARRCQKDNLDISHSAGRK